MEAERLAPRRLPDDVVLANARSRPPAQLGAGLADIAPQHDRGDGEIRFPAVADLPRQILTVAPHPPIPFVGVEPGFECAGEQWLEASPCRLDFSRRKRPLDRDEAVTREIVEMLLGDGNHVVLN